MVAYVRANRDDLEQLASMVLEGINAMEAANAQRLSESGVRLEPNAAQEGRWHWDVNAGLVSVNAACCAMLGRGGSGDSFDIAEWRERIHPDDRPALFKWLEQLLKDDAPAEIEYRLRRADGGWCWVRSRAHICERDADGQAPRVVGIHVDTSRVKVDTSRVKEAEREAEQMRATLETALGSISDAVVISDADGNLVHMNQAFATFHRFASRDECARQLDRFPEVIEAFHPDGTLAPLSEWPIPRASRGESAVKHQYRLRRKDTGESWIASYDLAPIRVADGQITGSVITGRDITEISERKAQQAQLDRIANHDPLTGLPNRRLLSDRLAQAVALAERTGSTVAVCLLDLDGFKAINDCYGHETGDRFLIRIAEVLRAAFRAHDSVARLGGDEFVLLLTGLQRPEDCPPLVERVLTRFSQPIAIDGCSHEVTASVGVTLYPADDADPETLLRHAHQAMYRAKEAGRNRVQFFDPAHGRAAKKAERLHAELRQALAHNELVLHYQPQVDLLSREVIGVEALIRWQHPDKGLLSPAAFIPAIEGEALERAVGDWVIGSALAQLEAWHRQGLDLRLGINVGAGQLMAPDFIQGLRQQFDRYPAVAPADVELEILESTAMGSLVRRLRGQGEAEARPRAPIGDPSCR